MTWLNRFLVAVVVLIVLSLAASVALWVKISRNANKTAVSTAASNPSAYPTTGGRPAATAASKPSFFDRVFGKEESKETGIESYSLTRFGKVDAVVVEEYLRNIDFDSDLALGVIEADLNKIPTAAEQLPWRVKILEAVFHHGLADPGRKPRAHDILNREIEAFFTLNQGSLNTGKELLTPVLGMLIRSSADPIEAERDSLRLLFLVRDQKLQANLAQEFLVRYPDRRATFEEGVEKLGLKLDQLVKPAQASGRKKKADL